LGFEISVKERLLSRTASFVPAPAITSPFALQNVMVVQLQIVQ
jgi:hypothetical protein